MTVKSENAGKHSQRRIEDIQTIA
ncbi:hypothetical protein A2U01_0115391, partial [Trifolium medium]|nr:hypothetical protein [Trifolium medium]